MPNQQWVFEIRQSFIEALPRADAVGIDPAWAQFWASIVGLAIAIGVPWFLHLRDRKERLEDKQAKARTYAISVLTDVLLMRSLLDSAAKVPQTQGHELLSRVTTIVTMSPALQAVMPMLHELGPASVPMQRAFASIKRLEQVGMLGDMEARTEGAMQVATSEALTRLIEKSLENLDQASIAINDMLK